MIEKYVGVDIAISICLSLDFVVATSANVANIIVIQDALGIYKNRRKVKEWAMMQ